MKIRLLTLLLVLAAPAASDACTIPVFRYALERWELSPYEIAIFHDKQLPDEVDALIKALERGSPKVNVTVTRVDAARTLDTYYNKLWGRQGDKKSLPWISARLPEADAKLPDAWAGPCTVDNLRRLIESPARSRLVDQLSGGATAVFLLLPGADEAANKKAQELLDKELPALAKRVQLPEQSPDGPQIRTAVPLKVEFASMRLNRDDPAEQALIQSLLHSEDELRKVSGPIVLPVFGRGRLLCSIYGEELKPEILKEVVRFLCGECSCQVKELNPGQDLLIAADWTDLLEKAGPPVAEARAPALAVASPGVPADTAPVEEPASSADMSQQTVVSPSVPAAADCESCCVTRAVTDHLWLVVAVGGAGVLVLVTGIWAFFLRK